MEIRDNTQMVQMVTLIPPEMKHDAAAKAKYLGLSLGAYVRMVLKLDLHGKPKKVEEHQTRVMPRYLSLEDAISVIC